MKTKGLCISSRIFLILSCLCLLTALAIGILRGNGTDLYVGGIFGHDILWCTATVGMIAQVLHGVLALLRFAETKGSRAFLIVTAVVLSVLIGLFGLFGLVFTEDVMEVYTLESPDGQHTVLAVNSAFLVAEHAELYEKNGIFIKKLTPDPNIYLKTFRPEYETIRWTDDGFTFTRAGKTYTVTFVEH